MLKKILAASLLCASFTYATDKADHPLFSAYPGAEINRQITIDYGNFRIPTSTLDIKASPYKYTSIDATGDLNLYTYDIDNTSTLKIYENYLAAANKLGFNIIFECKLAACGEETAVSALGDLVSPNHNVYNNWRNAYYLVAEKQGSKGKIYVAWFIGGHEDEAAVQQLVLETEPLDNTLIKVYPAYITTQPAATQPNTDKPTDLEHDNPLLARYPGAQLYTHKKFDYETFVLPPAPNAVAPNNQALSLVGDLTLHTYRIDNVSSLKVYENYKQALAKAGFTTLSNCELDNCGNENAVEKFGAKLSANNTVYNYYRKPYYLVAKKSVAKDEIYIALFIGAYEDETGVQQVIIKTEALENDLIKIDADSLQQELDAKGKALIYGIYFDTGKAEVKTTSKPTLDAIAKLLDKNKSLLLYVVGHTDDTGAGTTNLELSRQRAAAVVAALVKDYKIAANRLQAQGVGPFAPEASNTTEAGKTLNRRVELVKRLQ